MSPRFSPTVSRDGDYRLDLFVNGVLAARSERMEVLAAASGASGTEGWWARDLGLFACIPTTWEPVADVDRVQGRVDAMTDGSSGLVFARIHYGGALTGSDRAAAVLESIRTTGLSVVPASLVPDPDAPSHFFLGDGEQCHGCLAVGRTPSTGLQAAVTSSGTVLVGILFGPTGYLEKDDAAPASVGFSYIQMDEFWGLRRPQ